MRFADCQPTSRFRDIASRQGRDDRARHQHLPLASKHSWEQESTNKRVYTHKITVWNFWNFLKIKTEYVAPRRAKRPSLIQAFQGATTQHGEKHSSRGKSQTINTSRVALLQSLRIDTGRADCYRNAHGSFANYREPAAHTKDSTNGVLRTRPLF